ncbi:MAG: cytochrome c biogenesis protein ResB [Candidatus Cloacimonetes bacterium]|nr:cytochrome c biogenesis protein ResB [Candidatus Cloacimonadota bacterium]
MFDNTSIVVTLTILITLTVIQVLISKGFNIHKSRILNRLGSIQFAMGLLLILVIVLIISSITEVQMGRQYVDSYFYQAKWFEFFLSAIFVNIFASTIVKMSSTLKDRFGFLSTHAGILILIVGAIISKYHGIVGTVRLTEGASSNTLSMDHSMLHINNYQFDLSKPGFNFSKNIRQQIDSKTDLILKAYKPYGNIHLVHSSQKAPFETSLPAVKIKIKTQLNLDAQWLSLNPNSLEHAKSYDFKISKQLIHFELVKLQPVQLLKFLSATTSLEFIGRSYTNSVLIASCSNGKFYYSSNILGVHKSGLLTPNKLASLGIQGLTFHVQHTYQHAILKQNVISKDWLDDSSYNHPLASFQLASKSGGLSDLLHIDIGSSKVVYFDNKTFNVSLMPRKKKLPFQLSLLDFRSEYYTNSKMLKSFQSDIQIKDLTSQTQTSKTIVKNDVIDYQGWRLFQANYSNDHGVEGTIFQLVYDPGVQTIYLGCFILLLGMASVFWLNYKTDGVI